MTLSLIALLAGSLTQGPVAYDVTFPNVVHHEARITVTFSGIPAGTLEAVMSRSSPGRYALHEFAKNVYDVHAYDGRGNELKAARPNPYGWNVGGHDGTVRIEYTLYGDRADGTYDGIDETHAHLNMPATFMWAHGMANRPIRVTFHPPPGSGWRIATQLVPSDDSLTFTAPNLDYFMDSPTELSAFTLRTWQVTSNEHTYTMRLALHHQGTDAQADSYVARIKPVVREEAAVYGELAPYDHGTYTFIADYLPYGYGDGMEHRNSTILTSRASLADAPLRLLGTVAHEFFHSWNVERIRPRSLEPFDFERANMSGELWFAEGFTSYYANLLLRRAGMIDDAEYARRLSGTLTAVITDPGRRFFSPVEMSMQAPFVDAATSIDPTNQDNTFISYYTWGSALGLGLDLTLRSRFPDVTLDDYMRAMWRKYGKPGVPYTLDDLERTLGEVTGDRDFAHAFFTQYVRGRDVVDYEALLGRAGFALRKSSPGQPIVGRVQLRYAPGGAVVLSNTLIGSPLYQAGVDRGDIVLTLDGQRVSRADELRRVLTKHRPGDVLPIEFRSEGGRRTASVTLMENPALEVVPYETIGRPVTAGMRAFRNDWLGSKAR